MSHDILVLGAGMIGTCTALQLQRRGHRVTLLDRRAPGLETSYGNAGIIQREAVQPYAFPHEPQLLWQAATGRSLAIRYHLGALPGLLPRLARYWLASGAGRYPTIASAYGRLIAHCQSEHETLMREAGVVEGVRRQGYLSVFRSPQGLEQAAREAEALAREQGLGLDVLSAAGLAQAEPGLRPGLAGALHWRDPWTVQDPGALVQAYARHFEALGGQLWQGDAGGLSRRSGGGWQIQTDQGLWQGPHAVVALGPWTPRLLEPLGLRLPLFVKRGYHRHYRGGPGLTLPVLDSEQGFVLAPMAQGVRLTTGAELARRDAAPTPVQLYRAEPVARGLIDLPEAVETQPWMGCRPCTVDMLPLIGPAPGQPGLWVHAGHGHQGFTLGPASARLLADQIDGTPPLIDPTPYLPSRFRP